MRITKYVCQQMMLASFSLILMGVVFDSLDRNIHSVTSIVASWLLIIGVILFIIPVVANLIMATKYIINETRKMKQDGLDG